MESLEADADAIEEIMSAVEAEWKMGGLSGGLYGDFAKEVALRFARPRMQAWRHIATAPKDGSDILILAPGEAFVGFWREKDGAWLVSDYHDQHQWQGYAPTHWMPVPPHPTKEPEHGR